ncbi:hypothetical protein AVEN_207785-1 [Araneus ventricosus]|uniref:DDE-1 domain-containing protein n=1 Tax=Araneus ventricosus TaxID=182803 RepID=A0A4Y2BX30_ARAVE|nr:hypothetical protein AVEN_207785-1 [Araneus ventricosus]
MTSSIFEQWLVNFDKKMRNQARKVLLVLNNATCHAHGAQLKNVKLLFLPPNTTLKLQPLDHGIIKCFKIEYRQCVLRHVITRMDGSESASGLSKKISVGDALDCIKTSREKIGQEMITKCFVSCGISSREDERQLDLFDESTAEDQLAELSKLAGIEKIPNPSSMKQQWSALMITVPIGRNAFWLTSLPKGFRVHRGWIRALVMSYPESTSSGTLASLAVQTEGKVIQENPTLSGTETGLVYDQANAEVNSAWIAYKSFFSKPHKSGK